MDPTEGKWACSSQKNEHWNWGKSSGIQCCWHMNNFCLEKYQNDVTLKMT